MLLGRWVFFLALMGIVLPLSAQTPKAQVVKSPLVFEPNVGQVAPLCGSGRALMGTASF